MCIRDSLGAGKTTLLNELLRQRGAEGLALIVNDMGSVNIDAELIRKNRALTEAAEMVELQNGCICCTLQDAFMEQLARLAAEERVQHIVVEASGISNPASIAEGFLSYQKLRGSAGFYLDSIVAVADADRIYAEFLEELRDASENGTAETEDDPDIDVYKRQTLYFPRQEVSKERKLRNQHADGGFLCGGEGCRHPDLQRDDRRRAGEYPGADRKEQPFSGFQGGEGGGGLVLRKKSFSAQRRRRRYSGHSVCRAFSPRYFSGVGLPYPAFSFRPSLRIRLPDPMYWEFLPGQSSWWHS